MRLAWFAAASEGVGVSVGDNRAASIEVGVVLLTLDGDEEDEGDVGLEAGFCWLVAEVRLTLEAGTPATDAADDSAIAVWLLALLRRLDCGDEADARAAGSGWPMLAADRLVELALPNFPA